MPDYSNYVFAAYAISGFIFIALMMLIIIRYFSQNEKSAKKETNNFC
jgi:hypothetical protein